jgi:putative membrane protein
MPDRATPGDAAFLRDAQVMSRSTIAFANVGQARAEDQGVKALAAAIATAGTQMSVDLKTLAAMKHVDLPPTPSDVDRAGSDGFRGLSGVDFDRAYLDRLVDREHDAIDAFTRASDSADEDVRAFARKVLPTMADHQRRAQELRRQFGERERAR